MTRISKIIAASALATAAIITPATLFAEHPSAANVSIVHTSDLDLTSKAGQRALDHRLVNAAIEVCGPVFDVDPAGKNQARACRADVLAKARANGRELARRDGSIRIASGR